ncbi:MAG: dihydrolipoyl dehydrogenase [Deltaproteobacteria bacterium]|nr:dihydrolipoyl dehydrogenase [Deltaproteobacteria bacterium]
MAEKIMMPQLGESIAEGTIVKWLKRPGDAVRKDENVLVISTDKVEAELPAPAAGVLLSIDVSEGTTVGVGSVLGYVGAPGEKAAGAAPAAAAGAPPRAAAPAPVVGRGAAPAAPARDEALPADAYDVVVIGAGPGGYVAAARAGALGLKVALVEKDAKLGGTCLHRGCIPTKALLHAADVVTELKEAARLGVTAEGVRVDWAALQKHKGQVVSSNAAGVEHLMKSRKVEVVKGHGRLEGARQVAVKLTDGGERTLHTKNVVLAVGSKPRELPFAKFDGAQVLSSDHATGELDKIPGSLCIIGGGVIGIEFASLFARLGTKVTVLEMLPRILLPCDPDVAKLAHGELEKQGCEISCGVKVTEVGQKGGRVLTTFEDAEGKKTLVESDKLLVAVGRPPLTAGIGLESTGARLDRGGFVEVNGLMESAAAGVFAIGDCVNTPWLAHVASAEGLIAVETIAHRLGKLDKPPAALNYDHTPGCVYSEPPIAWCGLSEEEAKKRGFDVKVSRYDFAKNAKAAILLKKRGFIKLVVDAKHGEILGVHIIGPQATDLIAEPAFAMQMETTVYDLATTVHAHPTLYEALWEAASLAAGRAVHG